jgi:hypothetical protein
MDAIKKLGKEVSEDTIHRVVGRMQKEKATFYVPSSIENLRNKINATDMKERYGAIEILPLSEMNAQAKEVQLAPSTITSAGNLVDFIEDLDAMALSAYSIGMGTVLSEDIDKVLILATGHAKKEAIEEAIQGRVSHEAPASQLQNLGPKVHFLLDRKAAASLESYKYGT